MAPGEGAVTVRTPWPVRGLLRALAPPGEADALVGDLEDEAAAIAASRGARAASRWVWWQAAHSVRPLMRQRLRAWRRRGREEVAAMARGWSTDLKHVSRRLSRSPGFAAVAVLTLALGIGATSAIFSLAYAIWLQPLPMAAPDRLVVIQDVHAGSGALSSVSGPEIADLRDGTHSFAGLAAFSYGAQIARIADERVRFVTDPVTPNLFDVLGVRPEIGRAFTAADVGQPVLVLSHATWVSRFGRDPAVLSRSFLLSDHVYSIVGVMPAAFRFPDVLESEAWIPSTFSDRPGRDERYIQIVARLAPAATIDSASRDVAAVAARLAAEYPATNDGWSARVVPFDRRIASGYGAIFGSLLGLVGLFLVVGCANLAGLLIARNMDRRGELAVCASLGASRLRLARQMGLEAGVLAVAGGLAGIALSAVADRMLAAAMPPRLPGLADVRLSLPVLVFSIGIAVLTALASGVLPAFGARSLSASEALTGPRRAGPRSQRLQSGLVVLELALAMTLVVGASLMGRSFAALLDRDRGFNPHGVLALNVSLPFEQGTYLDPRRRADALDEVVARVARLPGVTHAGATNGFPGSALGILGGVMLRSTGATTDDVSAALRSATPDYFAAMGVAVTAGRAFRADDTASSQPVAIVNETLARRMWKDGPAVGRQLALPLGGEPSRIESREVVGVVADMHLGATAPPDIFLPVAQRPAFWIDLVVRTDGDPSALAVPVRRVLRDLNPNLLIENSTPIDAIVSSSLGLQRAQATLATVVAVLSAAVAGVGLYALLAFAVAQRRREIGIRLALGSAPRALSWWIVGRGMRFVVAGVTVGAAMTMVLVHLLRSRVFGLSSATPWAYVSSGLLLLAVAALALWAPSRRVLRTDPLVVMRNE